MENHKLWTQQQDLLRKALNAKSRFLEAMGLFRQQHAAVHGCVVYQGAAAWSLEDDVLRGLAPEQVKWVPAQGENSIAWLLWHTARIEDMTINTFTLGREQVFSDKWMDRLKFYRPDCGAGWGPDEVAVFSAGVSVEALLEYRAEVGRQTRIGVDALTADAIKEVVPESKVRKLVDEGSINPQALWLYEYYLNRNRGFFLTRTATSHNFIHLREAERIRSSMKREKQAHE